MDESASIYEICRICDHLFDKINVHSEITSAVAGETLHQRFKQWISYLGAYAPEKVSLDTRLRYSESVSGLVRQFLFIVYRNLGHIIEHDTTLKASDPQTMIVQSRLAEEADKVPETGTSSPLAESLMAIKMAIDGLYRLGVAIRQSSSSTLNRRIMNFAQENDDLVIENIVFLRLKHKYVDAHQNSKIVMSPLSLYRQLASSVSFRYVGLVYRKARQKSLEKDRDIVSVPSQAETKIDEQHHSVPRTDLTERRKRGTEGLIKTAAINAQMKRYRGQSEAAPTTIDSKNVLQHYIQNRNPPSAAESVLSTTINAAKYPEPPLVNPVTGEARCQFCDVHILKTDLGRNGWWRHHLKQDLKLYTCLSEACAEPPQSFTNFHDWSQHMDEHHSKNWIEQIHKPLCWCCDVDHNDEYFNDEAEYDQHVLHCHPEYETEKSNLKEFAKLEQQRPSYTCPICNCIPQELAVILPWLSQGNTVRTVLPKSSSEIQDLNEDTRQARARNALILHIGVHLKEAGLMSVEYLGDGDDKNSLNSRNGSIPIDEDGKVVQLDAVPNALDPQFKDYVAPSEPELLNEIMDWSDVKNLMLSEDPPQDNDDSLTGLFRILPGECQMRLLQYERFNDDDDTWAFNPIVFRSPAVLPKYAVLSHRWLKEEISLVDLYRGTASSKTESYNKLVFCAKQAAVDGLHYFWVDTCCIDKRNITEVSDAINFMFRWYENAAKCYVYLSDVPTWNGSQSSFNHSEWFRRGWTLQELLAPRIVEFFSADGIKIGNKKELCLPIAETSNIPIAALLGRHLSQFSLTERLLWTKQRSTTIEEDGAYCLMGIFNVHMRLAYGEGYLNAMDRLIHHINLTSSRSGYTVNLGLWIVPFQRNRRFVGFQRLLAVLEYKSSIEDGESTQAAYIPSSYDSSLSKSGHQRWTYRLSEGERSTAAVVGPGGVGKTQLVLEFVNRMQTKHPSYSIMWIKANTIEAIQRGYLTIARQLGILGLNDEMIHVKRIVREYLSSDSARPWLLILEDTDHMDASLKPSHPSDAQLENSSVERTKTRTALSIRSLADYIPKGRRGHTVFITRNRALATELKSDTLEINEMSDEEALELLRESLDDKGIVYESRDAITLLGRLGNLPLTIVQAASCMHAGGVAPPEYISWLDTKQDFVSLQNERPGIARPITWVVSFEYMRLFDVLAANYVGLIACIQFEEFPLSFLLPGRSPEAELHAISTLVACSFIRYDDDKSLMHTNLSLQLSLREYLRKEGVIDGCVQQTVAHLNAIFPDKNDLPAFPTRLWLKHAMQILAVWPEGGQEEENLALMWKCGKQLFENSRWEEAQAMFVKILEGERLLNGDEAESTMLSMVWIASTYKQRDCLPEAQQVGNQLVMLCEKVYRTDRFRTLDSTSNLVNTCLHHHLYEEAEQLQRQMIEVQIRVSGLDHSDTLKSMENFAGTCMNQGRYEEAETLYLRVVETRERVLGSNHRLTLRSIVELAELYTKLGRDMEAEQLYRRAINTQSRKDGWTSGRMARIAEKLAALYRKTYRYEDAEFVEASTVIRR